MSEVLNASVCAGVRLTSVIRQDGGVIVGYKITKVERVSAPIPVTLGPKKPSGYLTVSYRLAATKSRPT